MPGMTPEREQATRAKLDVIQARLDAGEAFEDVARDISEDELTRELGGEIGLVSLGDLQTEIANVAVGLEEGEVSEPFRTRYGYEIIKLASKQDAGYLIRHIFIELSAERADTVRAARLAHDVRERIAQGESFESLARQYSGDPETREAGGYIGEVEVSALDEAYRQGLENLDPGDISDVLTTRHGFQILKLMSRSAGRKPSFEEARQWIRSVIDSRRREELFEKWLEEAREEIHVKRYEF